jgi:hypothetical protein
VQGGIVLAVREEPWTGEYAGDTAGEGALLLDFFQRLLACLAHEAPGGRAPVHFYVWARGELARLVEACSRCDTTLLRHLKELLGCRAGLEQLIYSCLEDEVYGRYALGWSGRGLVVATSLKWFGRRFHWTRRLGDEVIALDRVFQQDVFDFVSQLRYRPDLPGAPWRPLDDESAPRHAFELRACFLDALPAPYWRACWGTLPPADAGEGRPDPKLALALRRYRQAGQRRYLRAYLAARAQALRWIEESIRFKNPEIEKPLLRIRELQQFTLGIGDPAASALDFLHLEQHVKVSDWIARHLRPPLQRVVEGQTLPLRDERPLDSNRL